MASKICLFGDSIGKGVLFDSVRQRYIVGSSSIVSLISRATGLSIDNFCKFGCTLPKGAELIERRIDNLSKYDYVLLEFGGNDSDFHWDEVASSPDSPHDCNTPIRRFIEVYNNVLTRLHERGIRAMLVNLAPVDSDRYYRWISRSNDGSAILRFLREPRRIEHWNEMYNNAVWETASKHGVEVLDIRSPLLYERDFTDFFCEDGIHPNTDGQRLIADDLCRDIENRRSHKS